MKQIITKTGEFFKRVYEKFKTKEKRPKRRPKWVVKISESSAYQSSIRFLNKYSLLVHIPLSMLMVFVLEWLSRHSFLDAIGFVTGHTGAFLYNSYLVFVIYTLVYLSRRQTFMRMIVSAFLVMLGIVNCIILLNRVSPFGFTDINMVGDLLTMQSTGYFSVGQGIVAFIAILLYALLMIRLFLKGKKQPKHFPFFVRLILILLCFGSIPFVTKATQTAGYISSYFGNLAQGYLDNGYLYGFSSSIFDLGMSKPDHYTKSAVKTIVKDSDMGETTIAKDDMPNIVVVLLESFFDVSEDSNVTTSQDPIPFFHYLKANFSTGHLKVPVLGAGTCNTEFEILTGMSCQFFGPGEYPQKTILKKTDVESVASDLHTLGYGTHVVHNNGGNFYSRANAFSMMGFDTFTSKETLDITDYTPLGDWPTDDILVGATKDAMDSTPNQDFIYTMTVCTHGNYPDYKVIDNPAITVNAKGKSEENNYQWTYYINMLHLEDQFIQEYVDMLNKRGEDTLLIMFGDHLPSLGITASETAANDLFKTRYVTWNNFGMSKKDQDLTSYQLVDAYLDRLGIHGGTMMNYNQSALDKGTTDTASYQKNLELLQYDLLYGKRYAYNGADLYPSSNLIMGVKDVTIDKAYLYNGKLHVYGQNFSKWSKVYVNGEKVPTTYESGQVLTINADSVKNGDTLVVNQLGSSDTIFRSSNKYTFYDQNYTDGEDSSTKDESAPASSTSD